MPMRFIISGARDTYNFTSWFQPNVLEFRLLKVCFLGISFIHSLSLLPQTAPGP